MISDQEQMLTLEVQLAYKDNERILKAKYLYAEHIFLHCFIYVNIYRHDPDSEVKMTFLHCSASLANPFFHFTVSVDLCALKTLFI